MIVMTPAAGEAEVAAVRARLETTGVHVLVMPGELTTAIGAIGDPEGVRELGLEGMPGVDRVVPISRPYKLASLELDHNEPSSFEVERPRRRRQPDVLPDRRAVHGRVARADARRSRARSRRPAPRCCAAARSSRGRRRSRSRGWASPALEILAEAREETGLPIVTEFLDTHHADAIAEHADVVQIGARNMQNYALLEVAGKLGKPVLLKRGLSSSLDELLMAADYVLKEGNERVMLCERGIRTFETATRFTLDLSAVPWLKLHTHLPVIVDPSHASGDRRLVEPLARAAAAVGADGIIVEVHQDPEIALCDGPQSLLRARLRGVRLARGGAREHRRPRDRLNRWYDRYRIMQLEEPRADDMTLAAVMAALSDPMRVRIVRRLASSGGELTCGTFELGYLEGDALASLQGAARGRPHPHAQRRHAPPRLAAARGLRRALPRPARGRAHGRRARSRRSGARVAAILDPAWRGPSGRSSRPWPRLPSR